MEGRANAGDIEAGQNAVADLRSRGVDGVILGCTELPVLLNPSEDAQDTINPTQMLAEAAVRAAMV